MRIRNLPKRYRSHNLVLGPKGSFRMYLSKHQTCLSKHLSPRCDLVLESKMENTLVKRSARSAAAVYTVALALPVAAVLVRLPFDAILELRVPYITFFLATAISASYGGLWPGLLTTAMGVVLAAYFFVYPRGSI